MLKYKQKYTSMQNKKNKDLNYVKIQTEIHFDAK